MSEAARGAGRRRRPSQHFLPRTAVDPALTSNGPTGAPQRMGRLPRAPIAAPDRDRPTAGCSDRGHRAHHPPEKSPTGVSEQKDASLESPTEVSEHKRLLSDSPAGALECNRLSSYFTTGATGCNRLLSYFTTRATGCRRLLPDFTTGAAERWGLSLESPAGAIR